MKLKPSQKIEIKIYSDTEEQKMMMCMKCLSQNYDDIDCKLHSLFNLHKKDFKDSYKNLNNDTIYFINHKHYDLIKN